MIKSDHLINLNLFSVDKARPIFPVGIEKHCLVPLCEATLSLPPACLAYGAMVLTAGAIGNPRAPRRSLHPCKSRHPHLGEVRTCSTCRAFTNSLLWLCSSSSSGEGISHLTVLFSVGLSQLTQGTRRQS